jgi:hypothetical protein
MPIYITKVSVTAQLVVLRFHIAERTLSLRVFDKGLHILLREAYLRLLILNHMHFRLTRNPLTLSCNALEKIDR